MSLPATQCERESCEAALPQYAELHCLPQSAVSAIAHEADCRVREVIEDSSIGDPEWTSNVIVLEK